MKSTQKRLFSTFPVSMETSAPPHGVPRGLINRMISLGLPPWAAWCKKLDGYAIYRMTNVKPRVLRPTIDAATATIWDEARVRTRIFASKELHYVNSRLQYPWTTVGITFSDSINHWIQIPQTKQARIVMEREGGIDNYITSRSGFKLASTYGEKLRRHIIARRTEIEKNFILEQQAKHLSTIIVEEVKACKTQEDFDAVVIKYSLSPKFADLMQQHLLKLEEAQDGIEENSA